MVGFPRYFHVNAGHPVLEHPLYLRYNVMSLLEISQLNGNKGIKDLQEQILNIMVTNDNMAIIWYLTQLVYVGGVNGLS